MDSPVAGSIRQLSTAFELLLHRDHPSDAREQLLRPRTQPPAAYCQLGLGLITFLQAGLGMEPDVISNAFDGFLAAELLIKQAKSSLHPSPSSSLWSTPGLEYDIMLADVLIFQAILHFMTETLSDMMKGVYKLTKAYKIFAASHQAIFSKLEERANDQPLKSSDKPRDGDQLDGEIEGMIEKVQEFYSKPRKPPASGTSSSSYLSSGLSFISSYRKKRIEPSDPPSQPSASITYKHWTEDPVASLVVGGASFGFGLFGLILSFLPPKVTKLLSWVGLNHSNPSNNTGQNLLRRNQSIRWLMFSNSSCGWELHGKLAGLGLLTYRSVILKTVGWLADRDRAVKEYEVLVNSLADHKSDDPSTSPEQGTEAHEGTIWTLHKSRLSLLQGDIESAQKRITKKLELLRKLEETETSSPPRSIYSIGLLIYESALISVRLADWLSAGHSFLSIKEHNAWSHVTYQFAAVGCFLLVKDHTAEFQKKVDDLFEELPSLFSQKKSMGRELPPHEMLVKLKLDEYKAKHAALVAKGFIPPDRIKCYWDSIQISPIEDLALMMMIYDDTPRRRLVSGIRRLSALCPPVTVDLHSAGRDEDRQSDGGDEDPEENLRNRQLTPSPHSSNPSPSDAPTQQIDLRLSSEETVTRDILLGVQLMNLGEYDQSRAFLSRVPDPRGAAEPGSKDAGEGKKDARDRYTNYVNALIYKALVELKEADSLLDPSSSASTLPPPQHTRGGSPNPDDPHPGGEKEQSSEAHQLCASKLRTADAILTSILELQESYPMRGRIESKVHLIKQQIREKTGPGLAS